jgi:hypothetical protein
MNNDSQFQIPELQNEESQQEPTVLDLYKSVTRDWISFFNFIRALWDARRRAELNQTLADEVALHMSEEQSPQEPARVSYFPWRSMLALFLALSAQLILEPPNRLASMGIALYVFALGFVIWAYLNDEWHLPNLPLFRQTYDSQTALIIPFILSIFLALLTFWAFGGGKFTFVNVIFWAASLAFLSYALWIKHPKIAKEDLSTEARRNKILWNLLVIAVFGITIFYRLYRTQSVPAEPFSDHAEKILDVFDISRGDYSVYFPRNTGREAIQIYWTLLVANVFGTGLSYLSLKLGTALLGILTLPYIYLLGKEYGNERVGLFALFLFGIAYWPNVISRVGLRFPLYPLFVAPTLLYLTRGLRTRNRNDFILCGIFLGLGLHGYSPFRIMPILVVIAFIVYMLYNRSSGKSENVLSWLSIIVMTSLFVFVPLLRYWISNPEQFGYRTLTRITSIETALPGPAWKIFLSNLYRGLLMFNWDNGEIWVNSLPHRPALDVVTGALFMIGIVLLVARYVRGRDWRDMYLLVSIPTLLMPSILSLAFPGENPALNRAGGGAVAAVLVSALALDGLVTGLSAVRSGKRLFIAYGLVGFLFAASAYQNFDLVFNKFDKNFRAGAWNSSDMGRYISEFRDKYGQTDSVWIVPFPYWVDTRLPGVWAGIPNRDFALWPENFSETVNISAPKMFIFRYDDLETEKALKVLYPNGVLTRYTSALEGKDFMILMVEK